MAERQPDSSHAAKKQTVTKETKSGPYSSTEKGDNLINFFVIIYSIYLDNNQQIVIASKNARLQVMTASDKETIINHNYKRIAEDSFQETNNGINHESHDTMYPIPINKVYYEGKEYDLAKTLPTDSQIIKDQVKIIEELKLASVSRDLSTLGKYVRVACCGMVGHTELQIETREILIRVGDITDETHHALKKFERTSKNGIQDMKIAYGYLKDNLEAEAFKIFTKLKKKSEEMSKISNKLSTKCLEESEKVNELGNKTLKEKVATEADKEETDKLAKKSRDEKTYQEQVRDESVKNIDEKEEEIKGIVNDEKKLFQEKKELSKKTQNLLHQERQNIKRQNAELKSKYEDDDREILNEVKRYQMKFESALLSNKESYGQELHDIESTYEQKIKSAEDDYKIKIKQNEKELQKTKCENQKLFDEKLKEDNDNWDKKVSAAEAEFKFTSENINQEYQDAIQASNDELDSMLTLAKQKLEAALEANEKVYSTKVKVCIDEGAAEINEKWSKRDADEKRIKSEEENIAKSECIRAYKAAQETRDVKLSKAFEDKQSKILKAETDTLSTVISDEQTLTEFDRIFEEKLKFDEDAAIKQIKENFQKSKEERERLYEQTCKERTENYDKIISDAENVYKHAETLIEKEYQDAKLTSDDELRNKLTIAKQKFDAALEAINKKYRLKVDNSWFWKNSIREEWSRKQAEVQDQKIDNDESARTENTKAHKIAQQTKQRKLEEAFEVKQDKIDEAKAYMSQNLLTNNQSHKQASEDFDKAHKEQIKSTENIYKKMMKQKEKVFLKAKTKFYEKRNKEKEKLEAASGANKQIRESNEKTINEVYKIFEDKIKSDKDAEIQQIKEDFQKSKEEKERFYDQTRKELKENYDKIVSDAENVYKLAEKLIEKEYQGALQASNEELNIKLIMAQQKLDAALEANKQKYQSRVDSIWLFHSKSFINEEWSKKDSEEQKLKNESDTFARTQNTEAHKLALETKQQKLEKALKDKQEKIEKSKTYMSQNLLSHNESHTQELEDLDKAHTELIISTEITFKEKIKQKEKDFQEVKKKFYEKRKDEQKCSYDKRVSEIENEYQFTTQRIECEYQDTVQASDVELDNKTKKATHKLEAVLEANKQTYSTKIKVLTDKAKAEVHEEWSKHDAEEKKIKSETENRARSDNTSVHKKAKETRDSKFKKALTDKKYSIMKAETEKNQKNEDALKEEGELNDKAVEKERDKNVTAKANKEEAISDLKKEKKRNELKAKEKKLTNDECSKNNKIKEDEMTELRKRDLERKYKEQSLQIEQNLKDLEKTINNEYQKQLKVINDHIDNLKERSAKHESNVQYRQEQRMKAIEKILMLNQQIEDGEALSKGQAVLIECLHEAKSALNNIQTIIKETSSFWRSICDHCKDMMENGLPSQLELMKTSDTASRQLIYKGDVFKEAALDYQGQWYALKDVCAKANEEICLVKKEINQYICENPTKEEAIKLVQKLAADLLKADKIKDKPANS